MNESYNERTLYKVTKNRNISNTSNYDEKLEKENNFLDINQI